MSDRETRFEKPLVPYCFFHGYWDYNATDYEDCPACHEEHEAEPEPEGKP